MNKMNFWSKMLHQRRTLAVSTLGPAALILLMLITVGCGRKAPPTVPDRSPLMPVKDLQVDLAHGEVRLNWSHLPENAGAVGYIVLRAQSALVTLDCPDCPKVFQKVATVTVSRPLRRTQTVMEFLQAVMPGFQYTFKVLPYGSFARQGPDSNWVVISYSKDQ